LSALLVSFRTQPSWLRAGFQPADRQRSNASGQSAEEQYLPRPAHPSAGLLHTREQHCALVEQGLPPSTHAIGMGFDACGIEYDGTGRNGMIAARLCAFVALGASWLAMPVATGCEAPANADPFVNMTMAKMIAASATILLMASKIMASKIRLCLYCRGGWPSRTPERYKGHRALY
jgi:hypothetical protein